MRRFSVVFTDCGAILPLLRRSTHKTADLRKGGGTEERKTETLGNTFSFPT